MAVAKFSGAVNNLKEGFCYLPCDLRLECHGRDPANHPEVSNGVRAFTFKLTFIKTVVSFSNIKDILGIYFFLKKLLYIVKTMLLLMHSRILDKGMILG